MRHPFSQYLAAQEEIYPSSNGAERHTMYFGWTIGRRSFTWGISGLSSRAVSYTRAISFVVAGIMPTVSRFFHLVPEQHATTHDGFGFGLVHGFFLFANTCLSLFNSNLTFCQVPNSGPLYTLGFVLGFGLLLGAVPWFERNE